MIFKRRPFFGIWISLAFCYLCLSPSGNSVSADDASKWSPDMEILEIISSPDNTTEQIRLVPRRKNSEIIVGEDVSPHSRLIIKCNATFPVQIVYIGAGRPEFTTFTNVQWREDPQKPLTFEAEASLGLLGFQGALRSEDTGNYTCRSIQNATIHSYFYIYVPGPSLFTPPDDYNSEIYFTPSDKTILIPCTAAHPKAIVTLYKTSLGKLHCPGMGKNLATYDPHKGFLLHLKDQSLKAPEGVYLCVGSQNDNFRIMEYNLIATNSNQSESGKHPCRPSPCGQKAECSVIDGHPVCYCFRGLSGNPYGECSLNKDRCHSNVECSQGQFCVQGKCTNDPCHPSPCGKGSTCVSQSGRPRCNCQIGYDGKPPYCLRKCQFSGDCPKDEICSRTHCQNPCPNRCGTNAECQVVQSGYNKTALCTCPPGSTGDPEENCYDIGTDPAGVGQQSHCPLGFIGSGPPNCRRKECSENYDCPPNHYCSADKRCIDSGPAYQCGRICGINAMCQQVSRSTAIPVPVCTCPSWATGDPFVRCFNITAANSTAVQPIKDPCEPNPCPVNSLCKVRYFFGRAKTGTDVDCICPPGKTGSNCSSATSPEKPSLTPIHCFEDPDCPHGFECVGRLCIVEERIPQCRRRCGLNAKCVRAQCVCPKNMVGDPHIACRSASTPCDPSPCANFAECREINGRGACRCILGYEGDAFTRCSPSLSRNFETEGLTRRPAPSINGPFKPGFVDDENYGHSKSFGSSGPYYTNPGNSRSNQPQTPAVKPYGIDRRDECDMFKPDDCGPPDYRCRKGQDGVAKCVCSSQRCGYIEEQRPNLPDGVIYGRYCAVNDDCRYPEVCSNATLTCYNPCGFDNSPCAQVAFSECRVVEGGALCTCRRGYVGNPSSGLDCRRDFGSSEALNTVAASGSNNRPVYTVYCDYNKGIGCDARSECRLVEGRGLCVCGPGLVGEYPDCRLKCQSNRDCFNAQECWNKECRDPCERTTCGSNASCRVVDHISICDCIPQFIGDPWVGCTLNPDRRHKGLQLKCEGRKCSFL